MTSSTGEYVIGPGVEAAIAANHDEARSDEHYIILTEGQKVSETVARDGIYYWVEVDNRVSRVSFR